MVWSIKLFIMLGGMVWSIKFFIMLGTICLTMCPKIKADMIITVTIFNYTSSCGEYICDSRVLQSNDVLSIDRTLSIVVFCEKTISSCRTIFHNGSDFSIFFLKTKSTSPVLSLFKVIVCWKGLSQMVMVIFSPKACLSTLSAWSELQPAQFSLIWSTWFPNHRATGRTKTRPGRAEQMHHCLWISAWARFFFFSCPNPYTRWLPRFLT